MAVLEGGYNLEGTALAAEATVRTLLGEALPLSCTTTKYTPADLVKRIYLSPSNLHDLQTAQNVWAKHWPALSKRKDLLEFTDQCTKETIMRAKIAGPSEVFELSTYELTPDTFSKIVPTSEVTLTREFAELNPSLTPKLLEVSAGIDKDTSKLKFQNILVDQEESVIGNIVLHRVNFDNEIGEEEWEYRQMGQSLFQLNWGVKEVISGTPVSFR